MLGEGWIADKERRLGSAPNPSVRSDAVPPATSRRLKNRDQYMFFSCGVYGEMLYIKKGNAIACAPFKLSTWKLVWKNCDVFPPSAGIPTPQKKSWSQVFTRCASLSIPGAVNAPFFAIGVPAPIAYRFAAYSVSPTAVAKRGAST